jgi:deoxyribose-phosphate aldolase
LAVAISERRMLALRILPLLDLTSLGEDDTPSRITALCASAWTPFGTPAAICVYPEHITTARNALADSNIRIATVVNFPDGGSDPERVVRETRRAIAAGADEIDLVLPYAELRSGHPDRAERVVKACRELCSDGIALKLILETGALKHPALIRQACAIGLAAGVDFLKTSTGKVPCNATAEAAVQMLDAIAEDGGRCGFKAAGGIRTLADAAVYLDLAEARLGEPWISPQHFRFGASTLFAELQAALAESA